MVVFLNTFHVIWSTARLVLVVASLLAFCGELHSQEKGERESPGPESNFEIRRLLATRCISCHNASDKKGGLDLTTREAMVKGGESGSALAESYRESLVWQKIESKEMPPKQSLSNSEINLFQNWLMSGAPWLGGRLDPLAYTSSSRAGYDWWSLQPLQVESIDSSDPNPIDHFVKGQLAANGLQMSGPASRRLLMRRMAYDVIGLPPSAITASNALADDADSLERWIDVLLASPLYGQRWARHWLDTVRFGESHGFERDQLRSNAWRYRDWVVDSLNADMPYDRFAQMQIAGDAYDIEAGLIATGMLVCGPYDQVGQTQQSKAMRDIVRQDELEDVVSVVCQTFLGLTVNCSRCHDHKFDPISQRDYYSICAVFAGTHAGEPKVNLDTKQSEPLLERMEMRLQRLRSEIEAVEKPVRDRVLQSRTIEPQWPPSSLPVPIARWEFEKTQAELGGLDLELRGTATLRDGRLHVGGTGYAVSSKLKKELTEKSLEVWIQLQNLDQRGGAAISLETVDGDIFDAVVFGERQGQQWEVGSNHFARSGDSIRLEKETSVEELIHLAVVYESNGTIHLYRNGTPYGSSIKHKQSVPVSFPANRTQVVFGLRHHPFSESKVLQAEIEKAQLYDRALTPEEIRISAQSHRATVTTAEVFQNLTLAQQNHLKSLRFELSQVQDQIARVKDSRVYSVASKTPSKTFVLERGSTLKPTSETIPAGVAAVVGLKPDLQPEADSDPQRRKAFAVWLTDRNNALFARVIVNRVWQYYFGTGIVATPNDFGFNGARPSHPELLDWLAKDFIEHGWSLKHLHRRILTSKAYQQSSQWQQNAVKRDAENTLIWRHSPRRMDAESLRDTVLLLAGKLDCSLGGPGFYDFEFKIHNSHFYFLRDAEGASFERRTIYRTLVRSARSNLLDVFDCPDPSTKSPSRSQTTTPLQSLSLRNNAFILRMSDTWAAQIAEKEPELAMQIRLAFERILGRNPEREELDACVRVGSEHGLSTVCRTLLNTNEFLYIE